MQIFLNELKLTNFKGIKSLSIEFKKQTFIYADNRVGKTTIMDAFLWLLTGKNSENKTDFSIKTLDNKNNVIHGLEHEVEGIFMIDGSKTSVRKTYIEDWTTKRGETEKKLTGHKTKYYWNDVPMKKSVFNAKVQSIIDERLLKLITNPLTFNVELEWKDRRDVLTKMAGTITNEMIFDMIATPEKDCAALIAAFNEGKTIQGYKDEISSKRRKIVNEKKMIPSRIDEIERNKPVPEEWDVLQSEVDSKQIRVDEIQKEMDDLSLSYDSQNKEYTEKNLEKQALKRKYEQLESSTSNEKATEKQRVGNEIQRLNNEVSNDKKMLESNTNNIANYKTKIKTLTEQTEQYRTKWTSKNNEEFAMDENALCCPTCNSPFDDSKGETIKSEYEKNFNDSKKKNLDAINAMGQSNKKQIADLETSIKGLETKNEQLNIDIGANENKVGSLKLELETIENKVVALPDEYHAIKKQHDEFVLPELKPIDNEELKTERTVLQSNIKELNERLYKKKVIEQNDARIDELKNQESTQAQEIADLESIEFDIDLFDKTKVDLVTGRTNEMFKYVSFKMYNEQLNGGQEPTCVCLVNGVPFADVNNASKINAGIDIINALTSHYGINAPIFIDNRESVNKLIDCDSQLINLVVSNDKEFRIEY